MDYRVEFEVRDNEIDMQGVVSNVNYPIYYAHTRHKFLQDVLNVDFIEMARANQNLILVSTTIKFKKPLLPNAKFYVTCRMTPESRIKFIFEQEIKLCSDNMLISTAQHIGVCMDGNRNKPYVPEFVSKYFTLKQI